MKSICVFFVLIVTLICGCLIGLDVIVITYPNFKLGIWLACIPIFLIVVGGTLLMCGILDGFDTYR